jgi:hypothetical protein
MTENPLILLLLSLVDRGSKSNLISARLLVRRRTCLSRNEAVFFPLTLFELFCQLDSYKTAGKDILKSHHNRLILRLLPISRRRRCFLPLFTLQTSKLVPTLSTLFNTIHPLFVICLCLFPGSQDLLFSEESIGFVGTLDVFLGCF